MKAGAQTSAERAVVEQRAGAVVAQFENTPSSCAKSKDL